MPNIKPPKSVWIFAIIVAVVLITMALAVQLMCSVSSGIAAAEALFVGIGIGAIWWQVRAEHQRRADEMTIKALSEIRGMDREASSMARSLKLESGGEYSEDDINKIKANEDIRLAIKQMLTRYEHFAVGVYKGVYSQSITEKASAAFLVNEYKRWCIWMAIARHSGHKDNQIYAEFEKLAVDLAKQREWPVLKSIDDAIKELSTIS